MRKVKALSLAWTQNFIKGDSRTNPRVFDGLQVRLNGTQLIANAAGGAALSLAKLDEAIDAVDNPTNLIMNKAMRRLLSAAARNPNVTGHINWEVNQLGQRVMVYQDLRILIADYDNDGNDIMPFTESSSNGSSTLCTSIYVVSFGETMVSGIQGRVHGQFGMYLKDLGELQEKPAFRSRLEWDVAITVKHGRSAARLNGILNSAVVV
jgi:hypothetical protein